MKNTKFLKVTSIICAFAMIMSIFSLFASAVFVPTVDDTTLEKPTPALVTYQYDMSEEMSEMLFTFPAILTETTIPATALKDTDMEYLSVVNDEVENESDEIPTTEISAEPLTEPTTTETIVETSDLTDKKSEKITSIKKETVERVFTVNGITVDCTGSSMSDSLVLYVKDIVENLPSIAFRMGDLLDKISFYDNLEVKGLDEYTAGYSIGSEIWVKTDYQTEIDIISTIYHELGHKVDLKLDFVGISKNKEWKDIAFTNEGAALCAFYGSDILNDEYHRPKECFAMAYEAYMLGSVNGKVFNLKTLCPKMYSFLETVLNAKYVKYEHNGNADFIYFDDYESTYDYFVERVNGNQTEIDKFIDWSKTATVGSVYHSGYGFAISMRNK